MKMSDCRKLNFRNHYRIIVRVKEINEERLLNRISKFEAVKLNHRKHKSSYAIIHKSVKKPGKLQITYFDEFGPTNDSIRNTMEEIVKEIVYSYNIIDEGI